MTIYKQLNVNISASTDARDMKLPPLDSSRNGGSNEIRIISL